MYNVNWPQFPLQPQRADAVKSKARRVRGRIVGDRRSQIDVQ